MKSRIPLFALAVIATAFTAADARAQYTFVNEVQQQKDTYPEVAADAAGNSLVVWSKNWTQSSAQVRGRLYDPAGNPLSGELSLVNDGSRPIEPVICARDGGGWVVAWLQGGATMQIRAQVYSAAVEPVGSPVDVATAEDEVIPNDPEIACLPGGAFFVSWTNRSYDAMVRRIEADGSRGTTTTASRDDDESLPAFTHTVVVAGPGGQAVVLWANGAPPYYLDYPVGSDGSGSTMQGRLLDVSGVPTGQIFQVNTEAVGSQGSTGFAAAYAPDGDFLVAYTSGDLDWPTAMAICGHMPCGVLMAQRFQSDGTPEGGEFMVNEDIFGDHLHPVVTSDGSGGFLVAWEHEQQEGHAKAYDANGDPISAQFVLQADPNRWTRQLAITRVGSAYHVVWDAGREIAHKMLTSIPDPDGPPDPPDPPDGPEHCPETPAEECTLANPGAIRMNGDDERGKMRWNWRRNDNGQSAGSILSGALLCIYDGDRLRHEHRIPGLLSDEGSTLWRGRGTRWTYRRSDDETAGVRKLKSAYRRSDSRVSLKADGIQASAMRAASGTVVQIYTGSGECWQAPGTDRD